MGVEGSHQAGQVGDVLDLGGLAVHGHPRAAAGRRRPASNGSAALWTRAAIPSVHHRRIRRSASHSIAQQIDEVAELVSDDRADGAVVRGVGRRRVELRRLQQGGGEVVGVLLKDQDRRRPGGRRDPPFGPLHRPADARDGPAVVPARDPPQRCRRDLRPSPSRSGRCTAAAPRSRHRNTRCLASPGR